MPRRKKGSNGWFSAVVDIGREVEVCRCRLAFATFDLGWSANFAFARLLALSDISFRNGITEKMWSGLRSDVMMQRESSKEVQWRFLGCGAGSRMWTHLDLLLSDSMDVNGAGDEQLQSAFLSSSACRRSAIVSLELLIVLSTQFLD
jgi:hypothetical protein